MYQKIVLNIAGIHCASCVLKIEKKLKKLRGIKTAQVNLALGNATVEYDPSKINFIKIKQAVEKLNYKVTASSDALEKVHQEEYSDLKAKFILSLVVSFLIIFFSFKDFPFIADYFPVLSVLTDDVTNVFLFLLSVFVIFYSGRRFFVDAVKAFKPPESYADMNTLVAIGTGSAFVYSAIVTFFPSIMVNLGQKNNVYYDTTAVIITMVLLGRLLESRSKKKALESVKGLMHLQAKKAIVIKGNKEKEINIEFVKINDVVVVKPGERIPVDGIVVSGETHVDESMISGESIPVGKREGSHVIGGTINKNGYIKVKATKLGKDSMLSHIIMLVEQAAGSKAHIQRLVDKVANVFVPIVILIALVTFVIWFFVSSFATAGLNFIAVLLIACPCALGLATPIGIVVGVGTAAKKGILIKNAESLEMCHKINTVVFDKTATLTEGNLKVVNIIPLAGHFEDFLLTITASLEKKSEHPIALSIAKEAKRHIIKLLNVKKFKALSGYGIKGLIGKHEYVVGKLDLVKGRKFFNQAKKISDMFTREGKISACIADKKEVIGVIALADTLKHNAVVVVQKLKEMKINPVLLTGDNKTVAANISGELGIKDFQAGVLPEDKVAFVKKIQKKKKLVAMVGDGINDAPALAQADVGIALSTGTDIAIESADVVLIKGDLSKVLDLILMSKRTIRIIKQNLFCAFVYNVVGIPIAAGVLYPFFQITMNPMLASAFMALSSVSVVTNSLRIKYNSYKQGIFISSTLR